MRVTSCQLAFKKIKLRVTSWNMQVVSYELEFYKQNPRDVNQKCDCKSQMRVKN